MFIMMHLGYRAGRFPAFPYNVQHSIEIDKDFLPMRRLLNSV